MDALSESLFKSTPEFPLRPSRFVKDILRKKTPFLNLQNTVAEAIAWMGDLSVSSVPVVMGHPDRQTLASLQAISARALLQSLLDRLLDQEGFTPADFLTIPLSQFPYQRASIAYPDMNLTAVARRMHKEKNDLLLVFEGIRLSGLVTSGDIFDAMIGMAVLDNSLFNTQPSQATSALEATRVCCLKQTISSVFDPEPVHQLGVESAILTAVRVLLNPSSRYVLLSNRAKNLHQLITAENILSALLSRFGQTASGDSLRCELMRPLESVFDLKSLSLTSTSSVFDAVQAIHFNSLTCAPVMSDQQQLEGIVTTNSLLKAFLDSIDGAFMATPDK